MSLKHYEVRFKNLDGKMITRQIRHIDGYENGSGPVLNLSSVGDEQVSSFDDIPHFYEIAPYLREFSILSPLSGKINLGIFKKIHKLSFHSSRCEIEGLGDLNNLEYLDLSYTRFKKIEGLDRLKKLRRLNLSNANLNKIPILGDLKKLDRLDLSHNQIAKIEGLDDLDNLEMLDLSRNKISNIDGLNGLKILKSLNLSHNQILKIEGINVLKKLKFLYFSHNQISIIENVNGINNLSKISFSDSKLKSIAGIKNLPNLNSLNITNTNVSSLEPLLKCKKISSILAENCPIRSLHGIKNDSDQLQYLLISPENLCPTGSQLYKATISNNSSIRNLDIHEITALLEFYRRSVTDLALQHAHHYTQQPLTEHESERLIHEATQKERKILEDAVTINLLPNNDVILSNITERFSVYIKNGESTEKNFRILL
ncbi:leucine-rich repeat domain-containing protein [Promethearchaeum syntrophicum]|uniref:Leucine-rich repeat domain-containing protein n=1 Tax=Promethearchaeum syntrophicum TaxID=2594042 RepID=A0A5B9D9L4_9ARCH|nr:leucine-rich repeat domain-containing protein [Candidatus Prometheoarchaeum syntrophicum]QEE15420.1 Leucine Rich repeats (2 copies) [Candidatus Prometheoarchaeum syntrophicum]